MTTLKILVCEAQALRVKFGEAVFVKIILDTAKQTKANTKHVWNEELLFEVNEDSPPTLGVEMHTAAGVFAKASVELGELEDPNETVVLPLKGVNSKAASRDGTLKLQLTLLGIDDAIPNSPCAHDLSEAKGQSRAAGFIASISSPASATSQSPPGVNIQVVNVTGMKAEGACYISLTCGSTTKKTSTRDCKSLTWNETIHFPVPATQPIELAVEMFDEVDTRGEGTLHIDHTSPAPTEHNVDLYAMVWREKTKTGQVRLLVSKSPSVPKIDCQRAADLPDCPSTGALSSLSGSSTSSRTDLCRLSRIRTTPPDIHLSVLIMKAHELDPNIGEVYVKFTYKDIVAITTSRDASEPVWNEVMKIILPPDCTDLLVELCGPDGPRGEGTIPSANFKDEPLMSLDMNTFFWHRRIKVGVLQLSLRRLPSDVPRSRTTSQGELSETSNHLNLPSGQPPSPRHGRTRTSDNSLRNAPALSKSNSVPWIIVTTPEDNDSAAPLLVNCVLNVEILEVTGLQRAAHDWLYVKAMYAKQTHKSQATSKLLHPEQKGDAIPISETLVFSFAGHQPVQFVVIDIIQNVELATAVLNPSRIEFVNSSHCIPLTFIGDNDNTGGQLKVDMRLVSKTQQTQSKRYPSRDPVLMEMDLRNKDQKIAELEVRMQQLESELARCREFERVVMPLQEELKQKVAVINDLRRIVSSGEPPSTSVLLVTVGHGTNLPAIYNLHVRLQYKSKVVKTSVRDNAIWDEPLVMEIDPNEFLQGPAEEETLLIQVLERDTCLGAGTLMLSEMGLVDEGPPLQVQMALQQEFWHKVEDCGELHLAIALRLKYRRPALLRSSSNLPTLNVQIMAGNDLRAVDDLHVQLVFDDQVKKTQVLDETYHPVWNETLTFFINPEDPCEELQVEVYSTDVCIGKGTVILSELDDEDGEEPIVEVQMFQVFLHHRTPAGTVRLQVGIHMNTFNSIMESRKDRILKLEDTIMEKDADIEKLRQQLAVKDERLWKLEQAMKAGLQSVPSQELKDRKTNCVFSFTVLEATGLHAESHRQYYVRVTFDGSSNRTQLAPGSLLKWDEKIIFEADLETLDDELEVTVFHDGRVSGSIGTGSINISDLEFSGAYEDVTIPLMFDEDQVGEILVRVECCEADDTQDLTECPDDEGNDTEAGETDDFTQRGSFQTSVEELCNGKDS